MSQGEQLSRLTIFDPTVRAAITEAEKVIRQSRTGKGNLSINPDYDSALPISGRLETRGFEIFTLSSGTLRETLREFGAKVRFQDLTEEGIIALLSSHGSGSRVAISRSLPLLPISHVASLGEQEQRLNSGAHYLLGVDNRIKASLRPCADVIQTILMYGQVLGRSPFDVMARLSEDVGQEEFIAATNTAVESQLVHGGNHGTSYVVLIGTQGKNSGADVLSVRVRNSQRVPIGTRPPLLLEVMR
ncbi:hypothetical protein HYW42_03540 [Candidatus Daviesbacteria bacterium]|nr:hypothetical protein [Candidatus Daviesbacteria bacterium]